MNQTSSHNLSPDTFFVLASGSPRRREFMELLDLPFTVITPVSAGNPVDETALPNETPPNLVQRLSRIKAEAVTNALPRLNESSLNIDTPPKRIIVLAADTIVVLDDEVLGKPATPTEAITMLKRLREQTHWVYSGITAVAINGENRRDQIATPITRLHKSEVWMRPYTNTEIEAYVAAGDPLDKAGAYGIQNESFTPVARLNGCFAGVMGFPLGELALLLNELGIPLPPIGPLCTHHTKHPCCQN